MTGGDNRGGFERVRDQLLGLILPGVLTYFVVSDFTANGEINDQIVFIAWIAVCVGAGSALIEAWLGGRRD